MNILWKKNCRAPFVNNKTSTKDKIRNKALHRQQVGLEQKLQFETAFRSKFAIFKSTKVTGKSAKITKLELHELMMNDTTIET